MKRHLIYIAVLLPLALAGCQKNEPQDANLTGGSTIKFLPTIAQTEVQTKSQHAGTVHEGMLSAEDGSLSIPVICEESELCMAEKPATKGSLVNGGGTGAVAFDTGMTFKVTAWNNATPPERIIPAGSVVSYSNSEWSTAVEYDWKKDSVMTFFAYANLPSATGAASVSCTSDTLQTLSYDLTKVLSASAQTDILMGFYRGDGKTGIPAEMTGTASIEFSHPLTAVQFKLGTLRDVSSFVVNSVSIEGVYASGTVKMTRTSAAATDLSGRFEWTTRTDSTTVSQTVTTQPSNAAPQIGEAFLVIPETFDTDSKACIVLNVTIDGTKTIDLYYPLAANVWTVGKCYTYTIGFDGRSYSYDFESDMDTLIFVNSSAASAPVVLTIDSGSKRTDESESDVSWMIKSVKVGGDEIPVGSTSFSNIGGISATKTDSGLSVSASARTAVDMGSHDYWTNKDGISGDTAGTGWSPKDWSDTEATEDAPLDLSRFDFRTETQTASMTTANCYVIRHAGTYRIPLVYGNAIKDGEANTQAYSPGITSATGRLVTFQNHLGYGIIDPFIENNTSDGQEKYRTYSGGRWRNNTYLSASGTPAIVWQDKATVIKDLEITGSVPSGHSDTDTGTNKYTTDNVRYLQFTVDPETICQNNAVIAVKDGSDNIMWSWHIWTTNDPALLESPVQVTNLTSVQYDFFPIGALGLAEGRRYPALKTLVITLEQKYSGKTIDVTVIQPEVPGEQSSSVFYQWGRKDPMRSVSVDNVSGPVDLQTTIQNPKNFYTNSNNWCSTNYLNLWTGKYLSTGGSDQGDNLIKTVYDPSPAGYKVPAGKAFTGFTTKADGSRADNISDFNADTDKGFINGWHFYTEPGKSGGTIFFPATQMRTATDGAVINTGKVGGYWTANASTSPDGLKMSFDAAAITAIIKASRSYANAVRPVKEN